MEILSYQIGILALIAIASILFGTWGMWLAVAISAVWTLEMVFIDWLRILQFLTILYSLGIGASICKSTRFKAIQINAWRLAVILGISGIVLYNITQRKYESRVASITTPSPTQPGTPPLSAPTNVATEHDANRSAAANSEQYAPPPSISTYPSSQPYETYRIDQAEMQQMTEAARRAGQEFDAASRACGFAPAVDAAAFDRWGDCMSRYGF